MGTQELAQLAQLAQSAQQKADERPNSVSVVIDGQTLLGVRREFKTGSCGYHVSGKVVIEGRIHQVSCSVVEVGSKKR